ncbi:MAG: hypothetical protein U5R46_01390 [Gammaproteobacteria bacterium]|nr:hypothetical protein [Gammaproteobacteria bacterium]
MIRDVARPFASASPVAATIRAARISTAATACIEPVVEAVFAAFSERELETLTFWEACILLDLPVSRVPGERRNIKITTRDDLLLAQHLFDSHVSRE